MPQPSSGTSTTTSTTQPWKEQRPYLTSGFAGAADYLNTPGPAYYPFSTNAPISPETRSAWSAQTARAANGSPVLAAAQGYNTDVLGGKYLNPGNPYLGAVDESMWNSVAPRTASLFAGGGRYGPNAAFGSAVGRAYSDAIAPYHYNAYGAERSSMDAAAGRAPGFAATDYADTAALGDVGAQRQAQAQAEINAAQQRYSYGAEQPYDKLARYMGLISGNYGGTTRTQQPYYQPGIAQQIIGGISGAAGTAASILPLFGV